MKPKKYPTNGQGKKSYDSVNNSNRKPAKKVSQHQKIIALLRQGAHNTAQLRDKGIFQVAARIYELRGMDFEIKTRRLPIHGHDGSVHSGVAFYHLVSEKNAKVKL